MMFCVSSQKIERHWSFKGWKSYLMKMILWWFQVIIPFAISLCCAVCGNTSSNKSSTEEYKKQISIFWCSLFIFNMNYKKGRTTMTTVIITQMECGVEWRNCKMFMEMKSRMKNMTIHQMKLMGSSAPFRLSNFLVGPIIKETSWECFFACP